MGEPLAYKGSLAGHSGWITAIATSSENPDMILTASRGEWLFGKTWARDRNAGRVQVVVFIHRSEQVEGGMS
jgi:guanine nucleotide-binding protein subunit beta-2-like 1 protein